MEPECSLPYSQQSTTGLCLSQMNPVHIPTLYIPSRVTPSGFSTEILYVFFIFPCVLYNHLILIYLKQLFF
jgi:hypothetical protein